MAEEGEKKGKRATTPGEQSPLPRSPHVEEGYRHATHRHDLFMDRVTGEKAVASMPEDLMHAEERNGPETETVPVPMQLFAYRIK